jgi:phosphoglucomutase
MVVKTIVTTDMIDEIARQNQVNCYNVLTGFKWIAELIKEKEGKEQYIIGGEESYGLLIGDQLRDKDAVSAVALLCEMAAYEKDRGQSLYQKLLELYRTYGHYKENLVSITKKGMDGQAQIAAMMERFRQSPPSTLNGIPVTTLLDYEKREARDLESGKVSPINLPKSNVLQFILRDGSKISARPSGTEPKIKFYFSVKGVLGPDDDPYAKEKELDEKIQAIIKELNL